MRFYPPIQLTREEQELADIADKYGNTLTLRRPGWVIMTPNGVEIKEGRWYIGIPEARALLVDAWIHQDHSDYLKQEEIHKLLAEIEDGKE